MSFIKSTDGEMGRFYTPESWKRLNEVVTKTLNNGEPYEIELDQIRTDGSLIKTFSRGESDYNSDGKMVSLHGTVQDITESKRAEERVMESEKRYIKLYEQRPLQTDMAYLKKALRNIIVKRKTSQ